jgi:hypothetical protein
MLEPKRSLKDLFFCCTYFCATFEHVSPAESFARQQNIAIEGGEDEAMTHID